MKGFGITHFFSFSSQYMRWNLFINQVIFGGHVQQHAKWKEVKDDIEIQGNSLNNFQKRVIEFEKEYKEFTILYKLIRGQCNKYVQLLAVYFITFLVFSLQNS
jgi:hypothetical protein